MKKTLEARHKILLDEYHEVSTQLDLTLNPADRPRLKKQAETLEKEIEEVEDRLAALGKVQPAPGGATAQGAGEGPTAARAGGETVGRAEAAAVTVEEGGATNGARRDDAGVRREDARPAGRRAARPLRRQLSKGLLAILALLALKLLLELTPFTVEHTQAGEWLRLSTYDLLQQHLAPADADLPVAVLNVHGLLAAGAPDGRPTGAPVPRPNLMLLLKALAPFKPRGVAIAFDFSPDQNGPVTGFDSTFFKFCRDEMTANQGVPTFLGVERGLSGPREQWLGGPEFSGLAGSLPLQESEEGMRRAFKWLELERVGAHCDSLSARLAAQYPGGGEGGLPRALAWAARRSEEYSRDGWRAEEFLVNYGPLRRLLSSYPEGNTLTMTDPAAVREHGEFFRDKLVVIGDADEQWADRVGVPGRRQPVPSVYVHASAAYTLAKAPLYELTPPGRAALDLLLSLLVLGVIFAAAAYMKRRRGLELDSERFERPVRWAVALGAVFVAVYFVSATRLMWDDFIFVAAAVLLEPYVWRLFGWLGRAANNFLLRYVRRPAEGGE